MSFYNSSPDYKQLDVRPSTLLLSIWTHPRATLHYILAHCPDKHVTALLVLGGIARSVGRVDYAKLPNAAAISGQLLLAVVVGGIFGWVTYYAYAWGLTLAGELLGGKTRFDAFRTVVAWALVPSVLSLALALLVLDLHSENAFRREVLSLPLSTNTLTGLLSGAQLVLAVWTVTILLSGIRLVQGFTLGRAILNMLLPGMVLLLLVGGIMLLMRLLQAASS